MLVLTRKTRQQIQFGNDIVVTILQVRGQSVRVGIEAPRDVRVVRGEIASKPARAKPSLSLGASPQPPVTQPRGLGESRGLFPLLRQRAQAQDAPRPSESLAPTSVRSTAIRI